jgi:hypothetical protein
MEQQNRRFVRKRSPSSAVVPIAASAPFARPDFDIPFIPGDITIVSEPRLMQLFSEFVQWQNYAATQFAEAEVEEERAEASVRRIEAEGFVLNIGGSDKVTETRAAINTTKEMMDARDRVLDAYSRRKMTGVMFSNCERTAAMISRELSRRIGGSDLLRRQARMAP